MRISGNTNIEGQVVTRLNQATSSVPHVVQSSQGSKTSNDSIKTQDKIQLTQELDNSEETKAKVQEAVNTMNEMLEANNNTSIFMYHEGLERYYVTVVDRETEEVVKEIPAKKLLDAFYEMQKMLGMIVDEKI